MAVETSLTEITAGYNRSNINTNFSEIAAALEDALSRTGASPNEMETDLDLNSNDLLNVGVTNTERLFVNGAEFSSSEATAIGPAGEAATIEVGTVTTGAAGTSVIVTNVGDEINAIFDITIPRGDTGASGAGTGDMIAAQNLNDVASKPTAFANIKQAATESATGVVELATVIEAETGTDTTRAVTPAGVKAAIDEQVPTLVADEIDVIKLLDDTVTSQATLSIDLSSYTGYKDFKLILENFKPANDGVMLRLRTSSNGTNFDTGASDYSQNTFISSLFSTSVNRYVATQSHIELIADIGNASGEYCNHSEIYLPNNKNTSSAKFITSQSFGTVASGVPYIQETKAIRTGSSAVLGLRVYFESGNIASGTYRLYGYK